MSALVSVCDGNKHLSVPCNAPKRFDDMWPNIVQTVCVCLCVFVSPVYRRDEGIRSGWKALLAHRQSLNIGCARFFVFGDS